MDTQGLFPSFKQYKATLVGFGAFTTFMAWMIWDKQKSINEINSNVRLVPTPKSIQPYHDSPSGDSGVELTLDLEIWVNRDIHTDNLVLNIVGSRMALTMVPWWNVLKGLMIILTDFPFFKPIVGLRPINKPYRRSIKEANKQPFKETITFRLDKRNLDKVLRWGRNNVFMMQLVLITGVPNNIYRQPLLWKFLKRDTEEPI